MRTFKKLLIASLVIVVSIGFQACKDLTELNENPNGVPEEKANANLILSTVLTETAAQYTEFGYGDASGVMQHTQKDAWFTGHNNYDWGPRDWGEYYDILRNNQSVYNKAIANDLEFHQGVALVMKSFLFAQITDLWGDAPYTTALKGDVGGEENISPTYNTQEEIYTGIIEDLKQASQLLSKGGRSAYPGISSATESADVIYSGDPVKWQKFANSLLLRYLMRVSDKIDVSIDFVNIAENEPIFEGNEDNALMNFPGSNETSAWPNNTVFDGTDGSNFRRIRPAQTLVEALRERNDPRIDVWFEEVEIPTVLSDEYPHNTIVDGVRYLDPESVDDPVNTNPDYVGLPTQMGIPSGYNLNPNPGQTSNNPFVSYLNDRYRNASGPLLNARLMTYAEVKFLLAEAAYKGWLSGAEQHYNEAVQASLEEWQVGDSAVDYLSNEMVAYNGTLDRIIEQKWIASWTAAQEAWFDYRRTGYPQLETGPTAPRSALPLRFEYGSNELNFNSANVQEAINRLESTQYSQGEENSQWDKFWILAGTNNPY